MAEPGTTYTCYQIQQNFAELLLDAIPGFKLKHFYFYNEIIALAREYMEARKFPNDGQRVNVTGDKIVELIYTEFIGTHKNYLWRTIYPLLEVVTVQRRQFGANARMVVGSESSKMIMVEKPLLIDDDEQPCSSGYVTASAVVGGTSAKSGPAPNQRKRALMDVKIEARDEVEGPTQSKMQNVSKKQLRVKRQLAEMREQSAKVLSTQPNNTFWHYLAPRPKNNDDDDDSFKEDDTSDTETVAYDDVGTDDLDDDDLDDSTDTEVEEHKIKLIDDQVKMKTVLETRRCVILILNLQRYREEILDPRSEYEYDDCCDSIDYESTCEAEHCWQCPICPNNCINIAPSASCKECGVLRPTVAPREACKTRKLYKNRPNALKLAEMASSTRRPYHWLEERSVGNVFIWDLLGHRPPLDFDKSVRAVAGRESMLDRNYINYPMFVVPKRRDVNMMPDNNSMSDSGLPWLDEVQSGDTVNILYAISTDSKCGVCKRDNSGAQALLIHENMESHATCYSCAQYIHGTERDCPFCRKRILLVTENYKFKSINATVR